jgi:subtilisin family serine protease
MKGRLQSRSSAIVFLWLFGLNFQAAAQAVGYTLILEDPPVAARFSAAGRGAEDYRARILDAQRMVRQRLESKGVRVLGSVDTLLNAVFVAAPPARRGELAELPGVKGVVASRTLRPALNKAAALVGAPAAWSSIPGGAPGAGKGVKIGIVDTGIDRDHPAFGHSTLPMPAGFPKCGTPSDCLNFTNNKVIAAYSYVGIGAAGSDPKNPAADSRPDDLSARDRQGHGTAVASCAAGESVTGLVAFNGIAPGAWLGNYKVFGSPGVDAGAPDAAVIAALEQAVKDGMDIVNMSLGDVASVGPLDSGADCGQAAGVACDLVAAAVESAAHQGVVVVVSAGNDNGSGTSYPTYNSIGTPAGAPSAVTVGASSNSHAIMAALGVAGLPSIAAVPGTTGLPLKALAAPLVDVASLGNDGQACTALPAGSVYGGIALVEDSGCNHTIQTENAVAAGAIGMILYAPGSSISYSPSVFQIPAVQILNADGMALKGYLAAHPGAVATIG